MLRPIPASQPTSQRSARQPNQKCSFGIPVRATRSGVREWRELSTKADHRFTTAAKARSQLLVSVHASASLLFMPAAPRSADAKPQGRHSCYLAAQHKTQAWTPYALAAQHKTQVWTP